MGMEKIRVVEILINGKWEIADGFTPVQSGDRIRVFNPDGTPVTGSYDQTEATVIVKPEFKGHNDYQIFLEWAEDGYKHPCQNCREYQEFKDEGDEVAYKHCAKGGKCGTLKKWSDEVR